MHLGERRKKFNNKLLLVGWCLDKHVNVLMNSKQKNEAKSVLKMIQSKYEELQQDSDTHHSNDSIQLDESLRSDDKENSFISFLRSKSLVSEKTNEKIKKSPVLDEEIAKFESLPVQEDDRVKLNFG
jgi:hypothetical protein